MAARLLTTSISSSSADVPADVKFLIKGNEEDESRPKRRKLTVHEIRAHKQILGHVSDVFCKQFYGSMPDDGSIEIKDATKESFEAMIDFIYNKKTDLSIYELDILYSLYYLGDKYNIRILREETLEVIRGRDITTEEVLSLISGENSVHEEIAEALYEAAAQSLSKKFHGQGTKMVEFFTQLKVSKISASTSSFKTLVEIMSRIIAPPCYNCKSSPCKKGKLVTREKFAPGANISLLSETVGKLLNLHPSNNNKFKFVRITGENTVASFDAHYEEDYWLGYVYNC